MSDFAPRARPIELFGPSTHNSTPTLAWNVSEFKAVDDRVRGGSSQSKVEIVQGAPGQGQGQGQLKFSGFLDTTTLGGAGFASQQHFTDPAFPISLPAEKFSGLSLRVKPSPSNSSTSTASDNANQTQPGGGKGPVTLYNFNLYTSHPDQRPDGRNSSSIVYEANFNVTQPTAIYASEPVTDEKLYAVPHSHHRPNANPSTPSLISFDLTWDAFKPTYRGRPAEDAPPLDPQKIALWSLMARSNFSQQSGPFELQVESIWAIPGGNDVVNASKVHPRSWEEAFEPAHLTGAPGFALYLFATIAFLLWICWALTPDAVLRKIGIQWYPDRYVVVAVETAAEKA